MPDAVTDNVSVEFCLAIFRYRVAWGVWHYQKPGAVLSWQPEVGPSALPQPGSGANVGGPPLAPPTAAGRRATAEEFAARYTRRALLGSTGSTLPAVPEPVSGAVEKVLA